jgi:hypothetical protein
MIDNHPEPPTERSALFSQPNDDPLDPGFEGSSSSKTNKVLRNMNLVGICIGSIIVLIAIASLVMIAHATGINNNKLRMESTLLEQQNAHHQFPSDFVWGAATSAYQDRIQTTGFAGHKGYEMTGTDQLIATIIEELMCRFRFPTRALQERFPEHADIIRQTSVSLMSQYPDVFRLGGGGVEMLPFAYPLVRVIASFVDRFTTQEAAHAAAI